MGLIDYFRILKALINLFLLFVCVSYVPNQNGKVLEETLAGSDLAAVKTTLRQYQRYFKTTLPLLTVFQSLPIFLSLCHI